MATETRTTPAAAFAALDKIETLCAPGQELSLREAIDVICEVWNTCRSARTVETFETTYTRNERLAAQ